MIEASFKSNTKNLEYNPQACAEINMKCKILRIGDITETNPKISDLVFYWLEILGLLPYTIIIENVSIFQVSDNHHRIGNSFVGICTDFKKELPTFFILDS
jgi:hypothetical protein